MFQNFENISDPSKGAARVALLRDALSDTGLDGFLIPRADEHQGEYVPPSAERLFWLTGFSGSAGYAAVLQDHAGVFVDGRYTLQARAQCDPDVFAFMNIPNDRLSAWLILHLKSGDRVGYDPKLHTAREIVGLDKALSDAGIALTPVEKNLVDQVWTDQPAPPVAPVSLHPMAHAGREAADKIADLQQELRDDGSDAAILTMPDSIAWLFNIRGADIPHTPVPLAFAIVPAEGRPTLFIHDGKLSARIRETITALADVSAPDALEDGIKALGNQAVRVDPNTAGQWFFSRLEDAGASIERAADLILKAKAKKNDTELEGSRQAHIRDGAAMVRFLAWLDREAPGGTVTEISAAKQLETFRQETGLLKDLSFDTISGAGPNGAIVHYRVTEATNRQLEQGSFYLTDSGGQYSDGTTDITRTIAVGEPADDMRRCYTLVLKGHIAIATARFPKRTRGVDLDPLARTALWSAGLDYDHGTGHGVGSYLSVHEGPASISKRGMVELEPNMILSNEPGYYREGAFGIRLENLVRVCPPEPVPGGDREMMSFETMSFAPFDHRAIDVTRLTDDELDWLNGYHATVAEKLMGQLEEKNDRAWLDAATAPLTRST